jgi:hypothetical protein
LNILVQHPGRQFKAIEGRRTPFTTPATFQTMMNEIFQDLVTEGVVSIYLDDILIFTNSLEEHH